MIMPPKKNDTAPFWSLVIITGIQLVFMIVLTVMGSTQKQPAGTANGGISGLFPNPYQELIVTMIILAGESLALWRIRKMAFSQPLAWAYISILFVGMVILPLVSLLQNKTLHQPTSSILLYWILIILAHAFFIRLLQRAYFPREPRSADVGDLGDVIDEFL